MSTVSYCILRSDRKTMSLEITREGEVVVRAPRHAKEEQIRRFVADKAAWLEKHLAQLAAQPSVPPFSEQELCALVNRAKEMIPPRVAHFAAVIGVSYGRVTVRRQHTRWGSCSNKGNLNFNCLLAAVPAQVRDYVIVHELCHRKQLNHSARFWAEVARVIPEYRQYKQWLKTEGASLIRRLP